MAGNPVDAYQALSTALAAPANSKEQADVLAELRDSLEQHPSPIPILCTTLIKTVPGAVDSVLKRWVLDLLQFAICRSTLSLEARTQLSSQVLDILAGLLNEPNPHTVKVVIQCLTTVYPLLFRMLCTNRNLRGTWETLTQCKSRVLEFVFATSVNNGIKLSAVKFMQRVILVQTRGISDPRLQNKNDPNIAFCPADHPFISVVNLEGEGQKLLESVITLLYSSQNPDILSAIINSWSTLTKMRPALLPLIIAALKAWTPATLIGLPFSEIRSVEKAIRILLNHVSRGPIDGTQARHISEALAQQAARMDHATQEEKKRKASLADAKRKRPTSMSSDQPSDSKRLKLEPDASATTSASFLAAFDFTSLPATLITELIVANIEAFTEPELISLVQGYRQSRGINIAPASEVPPESATGAKPAELPSEFAPTPTAPRSEPPPPKVKDEPVDPLQMDIDEEELEYEPDKLNMELSGVVPIVNGGAAMAEVDELSLDLKLIDFKLPPPREFSESERLNLMNSSAVRVWKASDELNSSGEVTSDQAGKTSTSDVWMIFLTRMVTRLAQPPNDDMDEPKQNGHDDGADEVDFYNRQDQQRQTLCDYIMADFPSRLRLATTWMNEEWYNDRIRSAKDPDWRPNYETWLNQIVATYQTVLDGKDRTFSRFLLDLPYVPSDTFSLLRDLCVDLERMQVGFAALREFVVQRPSLRAEALNVLLELTTHPEKKTRGAAIITVKRWVPDAQPMDTMIREFALQMLRKLQSRPNSQKKDVQMNGGQEENMEDGEMPQEDLVQTPYLPDQIELPAKQSHVLQHVELLFSLSVKVPEFLDEIFAAYSQMDISVQEAIQQLITALIRSLGSSHGKLLTLMRTCPPGAESLALRVLTIFTEHGRPSAQLVALVKGLINERDLDARFLIPIIAEMDKPDIIRHLPRIVSILNGQPDTRNLVRSVFGSIVTTPPHSFGSVTSNLPRVRQSELLSPAELMVILHESEKEIGLKSAIEAIGICFSMTDVYLSEVLAVVMQQIVDEPVLPVLFLRTVIQAVTTYKSLVGFVSTTLLSRLITKKIWTNPPLWEGFIRCAKVIAPASFGALLQLPKDQLRELVDKQPSLKSGLREYVTKKAGNKARVAGFLDIFGPVEDDGNSSMTLQADNPLAMSTT